MEGTQKNLRQLFFPIFLETLCQMLTGMADTLMLSTVGDQAVGAVGTVNTYVSNFIILFSILSAGMMAVMTQYIGAGRPAVARQARQLGLAFNLTLGGALSVFFVLCSGPVLRVMGVAAMLEEPARIYLRTVGAFCFCNALIPIFSSYLRSFGHTRPPLAATLLGNAVNLCLNAVFLFGMGWGVWGVALATGISRLVNLLMLAVSAHRLVRLEPEADKPSNGFLLKQILRVGLPAALETTLYSLAMTLVTRFLNQMDAAGMQVTARSYATQLTNLAYCVGVGLAQANAILTGWRIGAGRYEDCDRGTRRAALLAMLAGAGVEAVFALLARPVVGLFSSDPAMVRLVGTLLAVDIVLEVGRGANLVYGMALKTSGDAVFPMVIAIVFMFVCAVGGTWLFGIRLGWLAVGAYVGLAADECVRALCMGLRWRSGRWREAGLVKRR